MHSRVQCRSFRHSETCCLTLEYMGNGDVGGYIQQYGQSVTTEHRLRWSKQAAEGLTAFHSIGVLHCDISLRNSYCLKCADLCDSMPGQSLRCGERPQSEMATLEAACDYERFP
ncbi:hypothetical protein BDV32DRAFT_119345 [Aspergillus pseudonomiae]|nr:hypothetical protein BDV32DRAFT_119345 [Aspergillus pseudonomiae]